MQEWDCTISWHKTKPVHWFGSKHRICQWTVRTIREFHEGQAAWVQYAEGLGHFSHHKWHHGQWSQTWSTPVGDGPQGIQAAQKPGGTRQARRQVLRRPGRSDDRTSQPSTVGNRTALQISHESASTGWVRGYLCGGAMHTVTDLWVWGYTWRHAMQPSGVWHEGWTHPA